MKTLLLALAAAGFVMIFCALTVAGVIVLFGGRGAPDSPDSSDENPGGTP